MKKLYISLTLLFCISFVTKTYTQSDIRKKEDVYYSIKDIKIPKGIVLGVGGLAFNDKGQLGVCTRRGEVWLIDNPTSQNPKFNRFAKGLHEPLGLNWKDGAFFTAQRGELTKLTDTNGDGKADLYEPITVFPLHGNYHEYTYGPKFTPEGDMLLTLNLGWLGGGKSLSKWRGWLIKVSPEGKVTPIATGLRSPAGFGLNQAGDIFYAENQGDWVGSGRMTHLESGDFAGHPDGLKWSKEPDSPVKLVREDIDDSNGWTLYEYSKKQPGIKPPSVWFPHTLMGISTSDIVVIPENFGPYAGQLLVGDQGHSKIMRVFQEKINGVYQGICFPFREGFESGILRLIWGNDQSLYVGMTSRGWGSTGKKIFGLQRLVWNKKIPFEIKTVKAKPDGFELEFTRPVSAATAESVESYGLTDFTYEYHVEYGSPIIQKEKRKIVKATLGEDGKTVRLYIDNLRKGFIYEIKAKGIKDKNGNTLLHNFGYYTLNEIPAGKKMVMNHDHHDMSNMKAANLVSKKRPTKMPTSWTSGPEKTVTLGTAPGLQYSIKEFTVKAGSRIKLVFDNNDDMLHNLLIVNPNKATEVGTLAQELGLEGEEKGYVPDSDDVLYHTNVLQPHQSDVIYFEAPKKKGTYQYVCTFPGHSMVMRGVMKVE
ncbi:MAG: plastocyanin/azurin family copper-binding protein [Bacteroidota bacterium]